LIDAPPGYRPAVRLEEVSVFRWTYEEDIRVPAPGYALISAYDGEEGIGYGEGRGDGNRACRGFCGLVELSEAPE
jgi:hypothetical protein